jgi:uncharacterized protein YbcI
LLKPPVWLSSFFLSRGTASEGQNWRDEMDDRRGLELEQLTNAMVRLYKELFGRGPTKARSDYAGADTLLCTIQNSLTPAERNMITLGEDQRVREIRMFFQHASNAEFTGTVEAITGRKVRAFVSGTDTDHDISAEVFYLEPIAA